MIELKDCIDDLEVRDLRFHGPPFTFPNSLAHFMPPDFSDHTPSLVNMEAALPVAGTRPFKFFNFLTAHPDFLDTVSEGWEFSQPDTWSLSSLNKKQKILKKVLKKLHKHNYSEIQKRVGECNQNLKDLQLESLTNPSEASFLAEKLCTEKLHHLRRVEEADINGTAATTPEAVGLLAVHHFASVLGPPLTIAAPNLQQQVRQATKYFCSSAHAEAMIKIPTMDEIMRTMFKLNPNKSPGPDGFTSRFYSCSWHILGREVTAAINNFFITGNLPTATNSTILTLIPKFPGASSIKDYRPISCCNTIYKVISKLLVSKLKLLLPEIILPNQSAFIKGRLLLENCLLASEIVSGDHKNKGPK